MSTKKSTQLYLRLLSHILPYWHIFLVALVSMMILAAAEPAMAKLMQYMLDEIFVEKNVSYMYVIPLALVLIFLARGIMNFTGVVSISWVSNRLVMDLRLLMFDNLINLPTSYYNKNSSGGIISKLTYDVNQVTAAATEVFTVMVRDSLTIIYLLVLMLSLNWKLTLIALSIVPVIAVSVKIVSSRMRRLNKNLQQNMGDITHIAEEAVLGQKVVKIFGGHEYEKERFNSKANWIRRCRNKVKITSTASVSIVQLLTALSLAVIVFMAAREAIVYNSLSVGEFSAFFGAMGLLSSPIKRLTKINEQLQKGLAASESIFEAIDLEQEDNSGEELELTSQKPVIFDKVTFRYDNAETDALTDVSFEIKAGETVALVGHSGSGKTTIANLIPRFYSISSGGIKVDDRDIKDFAVKSLRRSIAMVSQDVILFNDTIKANIAYGPYYADISDEQVIEAAESANAMEFIEKLPEGINTMIGENGARLSGGQRQRIAIARAIIKDAPILILDEATSALDNESEYKVQAALEKLSRDRTTLVIAHRLSTIENADRIIVMDKGRIVEQGKHQELIKNDGHYRKLHSANFEE
ncbi:MAG: lipid A export permease/ATP-binding protein MsbA [Gammaproteobacteria bacterium]|nr:MAG: lipid A export permease/ATP-binding protein MsbA [Gammaproteobacteria bacterium]